MIDMLASAWAPLWLRTTKGWQLNIWPYIVDANFAFDIYDVSAQVIRFLINCALYGCKSKLSAFTF